MKKLGFAYKTEYVFDRPIYEHYYTLKIYPRESEGQQVITLFETISYGDSYSYSYDSFGNKTVYGNMEEPHQSFHFDVCGTVWVDARIKDTDEHLLSLFLTQSSMTKETPLLRETLKHACLEAKQKSCLHLDFETMTKIQKIAYLSDYCHDLMEYQPNVTNVFTDAGQALILGKGVCQDYSHILISFLRMLHIPARYVVGLMLGEGYTHAWVEAFCDGCWHGFDPTNSKLVDDTYIKLSHGRDYNDTVVCKGHFYGDAKQEQEIKVQVVELNETD